jgi:hypothetical protein
MKALDLKSVMIGVLLAVLLAVTLGANRTSGPAGTYQVTMSTGIRGDVYLARIETTTGKVDTWKMTSSSFQRK